MNIGVILSAGDSKRFGGYMNKQYLKLNGTEVVAYSIKAMRASKAIDEVLLVVDREEYESRYIAEKYKVRCIVGGETRNRSIYNALCFIRENYSCENVVFHDSVRPLIPAKKFDEIFENLQDHDAVITVAPINDALVDTHFCHENRENFQLVQSPEAFRFSLLKDFDPARRDLAIVSQVGDCNILKMPSDVFNMKITYPEDLFIAEQLMRLHYYSVNHNDKFLQRQNPESVLLLGGSGGVGQAIEKYLTDHNILFRAPRHKELDLSAMTVQDIRDYCGDFVPSAIINAAAVYYDDNGGLSATFDEIFNVNVKANEILIEYALSLGKKVNLVFMSSSSSTKGREKLTNYSAAKAALNSIVESQSRVLAQRGVYLNAVIPEKVNTTLIEKLHKTKINPRELLEPEDVICAIMYFASSDEYGQLVHIRKGL